MDKVKRREAMFKVERLLGELVKDSVDTKLNAELESFGTAYIKVSDVCRNYRTERKNG